MTMKFEELQDLNSALTAYTEALAARAPQNPAAVDALLRAYWLQLRTVKALHGHLQEGKPIRVRPALEPANTNLAIRDLKRAADEARKKPYSGIGGPLGHPFLPDSFEKLYTILGPDHFPDDDDDDAPAPTPAKHP